jgi:hypothetical protein
VAAKQQLVELTIGQRNKVVFRFDAQKDRCVDSERNAEIRHIRNWPERLVEFSLTWNNKEMPFRAVRSVSPETIVYDVSFVGKNLLGIESENYTVLSSDQKSECDDLIKDALRAFNDSRGWGAYELVVNINK